MEAKKKITNRMNPTKRKTTAKPKRGFRAMITSLKRSRNKRIKALFVLGFAFVGTYLVIGVFAAMCASPAPPPVIRIEPGQPGADGTSNCTGSGCQDGQDGTSINGADGASNPGEATQGQDGADGADGTRGQDGTDGTKGRQGTQGSKGKVCIGGVCQ